MAVDRQQVIIGPAIIQIDGVDIGLTTTDGVEQIVELEHTAIEGGAQIEADIDYQNTKMAVMMTFTAQQLSLDNLKLFYDVDDTPAAGVLKIKPKAGRATRHLVEFLGPGPNGGNRRISGTGVLRPTGGATVNLNSVSGVPMEVKFPIDVATRQFATITDTAASASAPTVASFQEVLANGTENTITDPDTDFAVDSAVQATFSKDIAPSQLNNLRFQIVLANGAAIDAAVAYGTTGGNTDLKKVKVTPAANLSAATGYKLLISQGVEAMDGTKLTASSHIDFTTAA